MTSDELVQPMEKRQKTGAVQDATRRSGANGERASVLDCGSPLPLSCASMTRLPPANSARTTALYPPRQRVLDCSGKSRRAGDNTAFARKKTFQT